MASHEPIITIAIYMFDDKELNDKAVPKYIKQSPPLTKEHVITSFLIDGYLNISIKVYIFYYYY